MQAGAVPVLADVNPGDGLIDMDSMRKKINRKTKAIVPVHLYGQSCDMDPILNMAGSFGLKIVEDCAQSAGATFRGSQTGSFGDGAAFSFYPTKNLGALGDAGAVVTRDKNIYEKLLCLRNYGQSVRYFHDSSGINSRMDELQAAVLRVKLHFLPAWNERRLKIADLFAENINNMDVITRNDYGIPSYHLFVIKCAERDRLMSFLSDSGIQSLIHYPVPVNRQKAFRGQKNEVFSGTEHLASTVLSIPVYPELSDEETEYIITTLHAFK